MSQADDWSVPLVGPATPTVMATRMNDSFNALMTGHRGASRPAYLTSGKWLKDVSASVVEEYFYDGTNDILCGTWDLEANTFTPVGSYLRPANNLSDLADAATARTNLGLGTAATANLGTGPGQVPTADLVPDLVTVQVPGLFYKADPDSVAFTKTAAGTISLKAGTKVEVAGTVHTFDAATAVIMPSLTPGTDYAVYVCSDGTVRADANFTAPIGYTTANSRKIGGFHYALGNLNVDATPNINAYSMWDLKWRPACADPRGMALVAGSFWCDIYLLGVNHHIDGTSKAGVTIADGSSPPKVPPLFGGNGSTDYGSFTWYEAAEVMASHGKSLLSYGDFIAAAYGVTEGSSIGADPVTTGRSAGYTSKWGVEQATGCMYVWGSEFGGPYNTTDAWQTNTEGRGSTYKQTNAALFGGSWSIEAGSRCAAWHRAPSNSGMDAGARGRCDHLRLV